MTGEQKMSNRFYCNQLLTATNYGYVFYRDSRDANPNQVNSDLKRNYANFYPDSQEMN